MQQVDATVSSDNYNSVSDQNCEPKMEINVDDRKQDSKLCSSIEVFDSNLPETVTLLKSMFGSKVYIVGTAHFSKKSQEDVSFVIRNVKPDVVLVELCPSRVHILRYDENTLLQEAKDINFNKICNIIKSNGLFNGVLYVLLLNMSAKITKELGIAPGGEFRQAVREAQKLSNCVIQLGDRPISITLSRVLQKLSMLQTFKLLWKFISFNEKISVREVEQCKQQDLLDGLMNQMAVEFPVFREVFIEERDLFLCHSLEIASLPQETLKRPTRVVGVVGIGHMKGITLNWNRVDSNEICKITKIPDQSIEKKLFVKSVKYATILLVSFSIFQIIKRRSTFNL